MIVTGLVEGALVLLAILAVVGTVAMLWVGASIIIHSLGEMGLLGRFNVGN